jgi:transcriptional regulator with XRE-family HTH domain
MAQDAAGEQIDQWLSAVGAAIAKARDDQNLTQNALAKRAGISRTHLYRIEQGENSSLHLIAKVLVVLKLTATIADVPLERTSKSGDADVTDAVAESLRHLQRAHRLLLQRRT